MTLIIIGLNFSRRANPDAANLTFFLCVVLFKGGSFQSIQAFEGTLSRVNIWNFIISLSKINEMSRGCGLWSGNVISWYKFKNNISGNIQIITPSSCSLAGGSEILYSDITL